MTSDLDNPKSHRYNLRVLAVKAKATIRDTVKLKVMVEEEAPSKHTFLTCWSDGPLSNNDLFQS